MEIFVHQNRSCPLQRVGVDGVDHPATCVGQPDRIVEALRLAGALERLVGVSEYERGGWDGAELRRDLGEERTFEVDLKAFLCVDAQRISGVVALEAAGMLDEMCEQVSHDLLRHPFACSTAGR